MEPINFFTPIRYNEGEQKSFKQYVHEGVEDYFYLDGKSAYVIPGNLVNNSQKVKIKDTKQNKIKQVVLSAIKIVSYMTIVIPLIMLAAKAAFRMTHKFHQETNISPLSTPPLSTPPLSIREPAPSLQHDLSLNDETVQKVQSVMKNVLERKEENGVKLYNGQPQHRIFSIDSNPNLIFKMSPGNNQKIKERFDFMLHAKTVCKTHELGLLVIPKATKIEVEHEGRRYTLIAEEKIDIDTDETMQEKNYYEHADTLNETIRQLTLFICKTGFSDMEWRNAPVVNNSLDANGNRKIALIDLEEMDSVETGLFGGGLGRTGLIPCVNENQGKIVIKEAENHISVPRVRAERVLDSRKKTIESQQELTEYYKAHNIVTGTEQIELEEEHDFSEFPDSKELTNLAKELVSEINHITQESSEEKSLKGRRHIYINTNHGPFSGMNYRRPDTTMGDYDYKTDEDYNNATYLGIVTKKLVEAGHLYKLIKRNGHGYFLQA